jgi:hypothetical protein
MPKFEIRCNTERVLEVEADDEGSATKIAEQTDFSDWDSADSPYSIERMDTPEETAPEPTVRRRVREVECGPDTLRIDMQLFRTQRELLAKITDLARKNQPYAPVAGDDQLLNGLLELTDALVDATETGDR